MTLWWSLGTRAKSDEPGYATDPPLVQKTVYHGRFIVWSVIKFIETLQSPGAETGETSEQTTSPLSSKISQANLKPSASTTSGTSSSPVNSPTSADPIDVYSFINPSFHGAYERYPLHAPFPHSAISSNGTQPKLYSPYYEHNVREMSLPNQASNPTTALREPAPFQQAPESTQYSPRPDGRKTDSDSLLLLANCATLAITNRAQRCPSPGITEVSCSKRLVNLIMHFATSNHCCALAS